jgi:hypothetical protein
VVAIAAAMARSASVEGATGLARAKTCAVPWNGGQLQWDGVGDQGYASADIVAESVETGNRRAAGLLKGS